MEGSVFNLSFHVIGDKQVQNPVAKTLCFGNLQVLSVLKGRSRIVFISW